MTSSESKRKDDVTKNVTKLQRVQRVPQWGTFYLFIHNYFVTLNIGGAKELIVLL